MSIRDNLGGGVVLDTLEEIAANTDEGKAAGALAVKELNDSLGGFQFRILDGKTQVSTDNGITWISFGGYSEFFVYSSGIEFHELIPLDSSDDVGLSYALGTQIKNEFDLFFGDNNNSNESSNVCRLGGFKTKDYVSLKNKNALVFHGEFYNNQVSEGKGHFCVYLIDKDNQINKILDAPRPSGSEYRADITAYDDEYKIAFCCYNDALKYFLTYAHVTAIKFVEF